MKLFVWDFHGVLEKNNEKAVIYISNEVLTQAGYKERFTEADNERFYGLKWYQYFERLLPNLSKEKYLVLQEACFHLPETYKIVAKYIKPNDYAVEVLIKIEDSKNQQMVISNSRQLDLIWFLDSIGVRQFFNKDHIIGVNAHQTHDTKIDALKAHLKSTHFDKIIVIGDSLDDLKLGKAVGATTYFYKHPQLKHQSTESADYTINDLRTVLQELN